MTKDKEPQKDNPISRSDLSFYKKNNFELTHMNHPQFSKLYEYPELHLNIEPPNCYKNVPDQQIKLDLYHEETLLYIFYNYTETAIQIDAYNLLIERGYFFSTIYTSFVLFEGKPVIDDLNRTITIFDPFFWKKIEKSVIFDKEFVESIKGRI